MKFGQKRGMEKETLVLLIVALGFLAIWYSHQTVIKAYADQSVGVTACKTSVDRNANLHIRGITLPSEINCPAQTVTITNSDSTIQKNDKIAKAMYDCWDEFGEGKLNLFNDEGTFCNVCAFVDVNTDKPVTGLQDYLMTHQVPDKSGRLYSDYLTGSQTSQAEAVLGAIKSEPVVEKNVQSSLPGGKSEYAVIFVYAKGDDQMKRMLNHLTLSTAESKIGLAYGAFSGLTIGVGTGSAVATGLMIAGTLGLAAGPPGWVVIGAAGAIGLAGGALVGWVASFSASPKFPEWAAFTVLREWNGADTSDLLKNDLGCTYFPSKLE